MRRQRLAEVGAAEDRVRAPGLPAGALGAVPHQDQAAGGVRFAHGVVRAKHQGQVLFGGQAPDIQRHRLVLGGPPARAQGRVAARGMKLPGVDPAADDLDVLVTVAQQLAADARGRHQGDGSLVVEFSQVGDDGAAQQAESGVAAVAVKVGVEVARHRQAQLVGRRQRRPAERAFGGDLHHVGTLSRPQPG